MNIWSLCITAVFSAAATIALETSEAPAKTPSHQICNGALTDTTRSRVIPVRVRLPPSATSGAPVILFSHGLGGSVEGGAAWGEAWAQAGYAVLHVQHPGSDATLLDGRGTTALRQGATPQQLVARVEDMSFVVAKVGTSTLVGDCDLARFDPNRIGAAGHSFGAQTVQALAGQAFGSSFRSREFREPKIRAFVAFSPSPPRNDVSLAKSAFANIQAPFFSITGTEDANPLQRDVKPDVRTAPYVAMPPGGKYLLVLDKADHMTFNGAKSPRTHTPNDDRIFAIVQKLTVAFFDAHLKGDEKAARSLHPENVRITLAKEDRFEAK